MLDLTGTYEMHDGTTFIVLDIVSVDTTGALQGSIVRDSDPARIPVPISGRFDDTTNAITFAAGQFPSDTIFVTTYIGTVFTARRTGLGVSGLAGSWKLLTIKTFGAPKAGGGIPGLRLQEEAGFWFADHRQEH